MFMQYKPVSHRILSYCDHLSGTNQRIRPGVSLSVQLISTISESFLPFQYLEEDVRTNRLDDSLQLFTAICSNKLLKNSHLVLLLNKVRLPYVTSTSSLMLL